MLAASAVLAACDVRVLCLLLVMCLQDACQTPSPSVLNEDDVDSDPTMGVDSNVAAALQVCEPPVLFFFIILL